MAKKVKAVVRLQIQAGKANPAPPIGPALAGQLIAANGLDIATISLAMAVGQFTWGAAQPIAGALADRGDLAGALKVMQKATDVPKKPRDYHLRQWYVAADLNDRVGNVVDARRLFDRIAKCDPRFADVDERLAHLGDPR